jgi:hypothetical protein
MRLKGMKRSRADNSPYVGTLTDVTGATHYEIAISGATKLIQKTFGDVEFEYQIDPNATDADWVTRYQKMWTKPVGDAVASETHETAAALTKKGAAPATAQNSIVVSVRRTQGKGTWWAFAFPPFPMAVRTNVFFALPPICNFSGIVAPISGDADLFLSANGSRNPHHCRQHSRCGTSRSGVVRTCHLLAVAGVCSVVSCQCFHDLRDKLWYEWIRRFSLTPQSDDTLGSAGG